MDQGQDLAFARPAPSRFAERGSRP
jgi:hypothetical protein